MRLIFTIEDPAVIARILAHLGLSGSEGAKVGRGLSESPGGCGAPGSPGCMRWLQTRRTGPRGSPRAGAYLVGISYFFSSSIAALALSAATDDLPALHATSASLTSVDAFLKSAERGD